MGRILVAGYSYFNKYFWNPAEEIARALNNKVVKGFRIESMVMPVSTAYVRRVLPQKITSGGYDIVLGIGLSPRVESVVIELAFVNTLYYNVPDVNGVVLSFDHIIDDGDSVLYTTLPVKDLVRECGNRGAGVKPGVSAGTYLCNLAGYIIAYYARKNGFIGGFLHIPPHTELCMKAGLQYCRSIGEILESINCIIEVLVDKKIREATGGGLPSSKCLP